MEWFDYTEQVDGYLTECVHVHQNMRNRIDGTKNSNSDHYHVLSARKMVFE